MPQKRLTAAAIERIKPPSIGRVEYFDGMLPGFGLRVTERGHKSWIVFFRVGGRQRRLTLGSYPALTLADARKGARDALRQAAEGIDPADDRKRRKAERSSDTFAAVAADFVEKHAKRRNRSWAQTDRLIKKELLPAWGQRPIASIARRDMLDLLDQIIDRGSPALANKVLGTAKTLFYWALDRDIIDANPIARIKPPAPVVRRERTLNDDEIVALWSAWEKMEHPHGRFLQLLLVTAQRRSEVANMRWKDVDVENQLWTIPAEFNKSGRTHEVPLSPFAVEIIQGLPRTHEEWLLPTRVGKPISGFTPCKQRAVELSGIADWRFHDLRRTAATNMARLGVSVHTISRVLNHVEGGVTSIYDRHSYLPEKRHALETWSRKLVSLIQSPESNVLALRK